jgi:uncharacterized protein (DUF305 family)
MKIPTIALSSRVLAIGLVLAGCSTSPGGTGMNHSPIPTPGASSATEFNDPDAAFAMNMIAHHQQAVEMADLVLGKSGVDQRVTQLAQNVKAAQGPEIDTMTSWLKSWGKSTDSAGMGGMSHGGMMSGDDMAALKTASGAEASKLFLEQMTQHHQGAITMAQEELDTGENPDALALAQKIIDAQTAEIDTMQGILGTL